PDVALSRLQLNILELLVFGGALWGALVFPVLGSFYWGKVTGRAFTTSVLGALAVFLTVRFGCVPLDNARCIVVDVRAVVGIGVVLGLMVFGFFGARPARVVGVTAIVVSAPFAIGELHEYATLSGSLVAYSVSTIVCWSMSFRQQKDFDFAVIAQRTGDFDDSPAETAAAAAPADGDEVSVGRGAQDPDADPEPAGTGSK